MGARENRTCPRDIRPMKRETARRLLRRRGFRWPRVAASTAEKLRARIQRVEKREYRRGGVAEGAARWTSPCEVKAKDRREESAGVRAASQNRRLLSLCVCAM